MRGILPAMVLAVAVVVLTSACDSVQAGQATGVDPDLIVAVGDTLRDVRLHIPDGLAPGDDASLLIALHGSGDVGRGFQRGSGLDASGPDDMIIAYPTAAKGNWAEGCNCNVADRLEIDDLGFMRSLIDSVAAHYRVQRSRTYAVGFSQGGLFAYRLACAMSADFAAVASVAAPMSVPLSEACTPDRAVSLLTFQGDADAVLPFGGSDNGAFSLLSALDTGVYWAAKNDCGGGARDSFRVEGVSVVRDHWPECRDGTVVTTYRVKAGTHRWFDSGPDARPILMDFFIGAGVR